MKYATVEQVEAGFKSLTEDEKAICETLLEEAAYIIDSYCDRADESAKAIVSARMVRRSIASAGDNGIPMGAVQGSMSGLGYTQSWTVSNGTYGELYISKTEKTILRFGDRIGSHSPLEDM